MIEIAAIPVCDLGIECLPSDIFFVVPKPTFFVIVAFVVCHRKTMYFSFGPPI